MTVAFGEYVGELKPGSSSRSTQPAANVILSRISHGESSGPRWAGLTLRYVGRGTEHYTIDGRYYRLADDQVMLSPQRLGSDVEVRRNGAETLGLCVFLPDVDEETAALIDGPIVLPASCGLGAAMRLSLKRLAGVQRCPLEPERIVSATSASLIDTVVALDREIDRARGMKRRTRFESVRRLHLARAYLHHVTERAVPLEELAREAAVSQFQLLRGFRDCFGETPAAYHRRLRLTLAREMAEGEGLAYSFVADRFGFAGGASFSHAYRRTFGTPPVRELARQISVAA